MEKQLSEINAILEKPELEILNGFSTPNFPVIFIVGCARSGTTLLLQYLAGSGHFAYPSNLLSRFYAAPWIGAHIQEMLTRHDFRGEIFDFRPETPFKSELGKTEGALAPNEFWYFWRRFFQFGNIQVLKPSELKRIDPKKFIQELAAIESVFAKPLAMKAMIMNWNLNFLDSIIEKAVFLFIKRHPLYNIQSLLEARQNYFGNVREWYSFKPPEYNRLKDSSPAEQVSGQVFHTNQAIEKALETIPSAKKLRVDYERFCEDPKAVFCALKVKMNDLGFSKKMDGVPSMEFKNTNNQRLTSSYRKEIIKSYQKISGEKLEF